MTSSGPCRFPAVRSGGHQNLPKKISWGGGLAGVGAGPVHVKLKECFLVTGWPMQSEAFM